jgi:signal transduction histidine kinase
MSDTSQPHDFQADIDAIGQVAAVPTILDVVCQVTGMGFAAVARVTPERWVACGVRDDVQFGLKPGGELKVETTICDAIQDSLRPVLIDHVAEDSVYKDHPCPAMYGFQSYVSVPIVLPDGSFFGTLCAIDPRPAKVNTPHISGMFRMFAELIAFHIESRRKLTVGDGSLVNERRTAQLHEQFIAALGHDLRNPLAAISSGVELIGRTRLEDRAARLVPLMAASVARMSKLIDNVLDFARGRLSDGLTLNRATCDLFPVLTQVVEELRRSHPERDIETDFALDVPIHCDCTRLSQIASNLLANALSYGTPDRPVIVRAATRAGEFELSVSNSGDPIPPTALERLFEPFERGAAGPSQQGLGLGLYIASRIAEAHGGTLNATSTPEETRFTFRMPAAVA